MKNKAHYSNEPIGIQSNVQSRNMKFENKLTQKLDNKLIFSLLLLAGFVLYLLQSIYFAIHMDVTMDEGTYLIKGLYIIRGIYSSFQDYGFWMNKMPFAFLIPGSIQYLFTPGIGTGRFFSVVLNLFLLSGLFFTAKRSLGKYWALALIWIATLSSGLITYYSAATTQIQVATLLIWALFFLLGDGRKPWEIILATVLACLVVLIRQNMIFMMPFLVLYIFWKFGKREGWFSLGLSVLFLGGYHLMYWPNIMRIWAPWLPEGITKLFLGEKFLQGSISQNVHAIDMNLWSRGFAFVESFRVHGFIMLGLVIVWFILPARKNWKSDTHFKDAVFTGITFLVLTAAHLWASVLQDACVFCYSGYVAFFSPMGVIFIALCLQSAKGIHSKWQEISGYILLALFYFGFGYANYFDLLNWVADIPFFRIKNKRILPGQTEIWRLLHNKFGWPFENLERILPAFFALGIFILVCFILFISTRKRKKLNPNFSISPWILSGSMGLIMILSIFPIPGSAKAGEVCSDNMLSGYQKVAEEIIPLIPQNSTIYWENSTSPIPLLYLQDMNIFPAQMDQHFNRLPNGDSDLINLYGYWNDELAAQWREAADYLLIEEPILPGMEEHTEIPSSFRQIGVTEPVAACRPYSAIYIYEKQQN